MLTELINFHCLCYPGDRDGTRKDFPWCCHIELSTCNDDCLCEMQKPTQMQIISNKRNMDFNYNIHCVGSCASDLVTYQERLFCSYLNSAKKKNRKMNRKQIQSLKKSWGNPYFQEHNRQSNSQRRLLRQDRKAENYREIKGKELPHCRAWSKPLDL